MSSDPIDRLNSALSGRYRIEREIGEGGMATVYLAVDPVQALRSEWGHAVRPYLTNTSRSTLSGLPSGAR